MALQIHLIKKAHGGGDGFIDGVTHVLFNNDDGDADAVIIANAETACRSAGFALPDSGYFDTVELVGPPTAGIMTTELDIIVFTPLGDTRVIA